MKREESERTGETKKDEIRTLLPGIMQQTVKEGTPVEAILTVMVSFLKPLEDVIGSLDVLYDVERTEERFVPFLAQCAMLAWLVDSGIEPGSLRRLIANIRDLSILRGTSQGLCRFLEIATGAEGFQIIEDVVEENVEEKKTAKRVLPFHIKVIYPAEARAKFDLITQIIEHEKPAYMTYELEALSNEGGENHE